jgi:hypothetical protein
MRLQHFEYIMLIKEAYKKKRTNNEQPLLTLSTPGKIRRECLNVYRERYHKKDEQTLRAFFGPEQPKRQFLQIISEFQTDKFKSLDQYLKGITENTDNANLELLAWLIDFPHRPYTYGKDVILTEEELALIDKTKEPGEVSEKDILQNKSAEQRDFLDDEADKDLKAYKDEAPTALTADSKNSTKKNKTTRAVIFFLILIIGSGGIYIIMDKAKADCVYWTGEYYEPVPCDEEPNGRRIVPLNEKKMKRLRMITRKDTLTERSIGKVYYIKDGGVKYYTEGGDYPEDLNRSLKKLSRNIFEKDSINRVR